MSVNHVFDDWYMTKSDRITLGRGGALELQYEFFGVWKANLTGTPAPTNATGAIAAAVGAGAHLVVDASFVPPTGSNISPPLTSYVLASMTVERVPDTNQNSDVVWMFRCRLEYADLVNTAQPFVEVKQTATLQTVSAFRVNPTIPADDWTGLPENNTAWHSITDIGGYKVDWNSQPIKYALTNHTIEITIQRPSPIWLQNGTRSLGAISALSVDSVYIGYRNDGALGWMGDDGELMLTGVTCVPFTNGLYSLTYQFRWHPWKHALQSPYMVGGTYDKAKNPDNSLRLHNNNIFWNQPHLAGIDFEGTLQLSTEEWDAVGV